MKTSHKSCIVAILCVIFNTSSYTDTLKHTEIVIQYTIQTFGTKSNGCSWLGPVVDKQNSLFWACVTYEVCQLCDKAQDHMTVPRQLNDWNANLSIFIILDVSHSHFKQYQYFQRFLEHATLRSVLQDCIFCPHGSLPLEDPLDEERQYLVRYVADSSAGQGTQVQRPRQIAYPSKKKLLQGRMWFHFFMRKFLQNAFRVGVSGESHPQCIG